MIEYTPAPIHLWEPIIKLRDEELPFRYIGCFYNEATGIYTCEIGCLGWHNRFAWSNDEAELLRFPEDIFRLRFYQMVHEIKERLS